MRAITLRNHQVINTPVVAGKSILRCPGDTRTYLIPDNLVRAFINQIVECGILGQIRGDGTMTWEAMALRATLDHEAVSFGGTVWA